MNIAIIHYRVGKTDGVSLEIAKRKTILQKLGHNVKVISGPVNIGCDYIIDELEFETPAIKQIKENAFSFFDNTSLTEKELKDELWKTSRLIENRFYFIQNKEKFDLILLHNIFSHGRHIAAASAFAAVINNLQIPCLATNHDYYWEREEYTRPAYPFITEYLNEYIPYKSDFITYISINSIAAEQCKNKRNIKSEVVGDIFDFEQPVWKEDEYNHDFRKKLRIKDNDLVILQATRIVPRKAIESAVIFTEKLSQKKHQLSGKELYNGRKITPHSRITLLLAGYAEESSMDYMQKIKEFAYSRIDVRFASEIIDAGREEGNKKKYSLWDAYVHSDLITYPSLSEGWGNQFIEAVFAKKPIVLFEYPVFKKDIKKEGYSYISLGDTLKSIDDNGLVVLPEKAIEDAVSKSINTLLSQSTPSLLEENFQKGKKYHGFQSIYNYIIAFLQKITKGTKVLFVFLI